MLIAKVTESGIEVADHSYFLPDTSFGVAGPTVAQIQELGFLQVTVWKSHNRETEKLVAVVPYVEDGQVFTIQVEPKTEEDLANEAASLSAANKAARAQAYKDESDPLYFKAQRGEATMQEWLDKVQEIKNRYPTN